MLAALLRPIFGAESGKEEKDREETPELTAA